MARAGDAGGIGLGGVLFGVATLLPFVVAAAVSGSAVLAFLVLIGRVDHRDTRAEHHEGTTVREEARRLRELLRERAGLRAFLAANTLWELSLGALKTFIILYLTKGLSVAIGTASAAVAGAAVFIAVAAPVSGKLSPIASAPRG